MQDGLVSPGNGLFNRMGGAATPLPLATSGSVLLRLLVDWVAMET